MKETMNMIVTGGKVSEIKNAVITGTRLYIEDHGCLDAYLYLDYGGLSQGFGGYALYLPKGFKHHGEGGDYTGHFIYRVLEIADVSNWSDLKGKTIRVMSNSGDIEAIGHIVKDVWFNPKEEFELMRRG